MEGVAPIRPADGPGGDRPWVVTGAAGFIGSHLVERLLRDRHVPVLGLDNLATGHRSNLDDVRRSVGDVAWQRFTFLEGDVRDAETCQQACEGAAIVLHQAALGSVPRSIADPQETHDVNATGTLVLLAAARAAGVERLVYASSSSVYGDDPELPRVEPRLGRPLSPYAASKRTGELYAHAFAHAYGLAVIGLRYFNVFGPRQDPAGPYAAVIPRWFQALLNGVRPTIYGDGATTRDFCYVADAVTANLRAATTTEPAALGQVYNVATGRQTALNDLHGLIRARVARVRADAAGVEAEHRPPRPGDVRHSRADVTRARERLGFTAEVSLESGLDATAAWFADRNARPEPEAAI